MFDAVFDVVVVGAGPAGSAAAFFLARRGYDVLLLDRARFPRHKVCGDGLTPRALAALAGMGLAGLVADGCKVRGIRLCGHENGSERIRLFEARGGEPDYGLVLRRDLLDARLAAAAEGAGATFWTATAGTGLARDSAGLPVALEVSRNGRSLTAGARFFVIAEGSHGRLAASFRRSGDGPAVRGLAVRQYVAGVADLPPLFDVRLPIRHRGRVIPGYGWVFPAGGARANVGVGFFPGKGFPAKIDIRRVQDGFLATLLDRDERFAGARVCSGLEGAHLAVGLSPADAAHPRVLLVGDAARLINPFTGEGVAYALESGELAARAIDRALQRGSVEAPEYRRFLDERYRRHVRLRTELPGLYGLARVYDRLEPEFGGDRGGGRVIGTALRDLVSDHEPRSAGGVREILWSGLAEDPALARDRQEIERRVLDAIGQRSALAGEIALYSRHGFAFLPGFLGTLLTLTARRGRRPGEDVLRLATVAELFGVARLFHHEVRGGGRAGDESRRAGNALDVLVGDTVIAAIFALVAELPDDLARVVSDTLVDRSQAGLAARLTGAAERLDAFAGKLVGLACDGSGPAAESTRPLARYAAALTHAVQICQELWADFEGAGLRNGEPALFLLRSGAVGRHAELAAQRGLDLRPFVVRAGEGADNELLALLAAAKACGALDQALAEARAAQAAAGAALSGTELADLSLVRLARNASSLIHHVEATLARKLAGSDCSEALQCR